MFISYFFGKPQQLDIRTEQIKTKIYECLSEGQTPEQVMADHRLAGWQMLKSKSDALLYIKYIHRRMESVA